MSFPTRLRVVGHDEAHGLDLVDLAAADLEDVRRRQIERFEIHVPCLDARNTHDLERFLLHRLTELRQAEHQALLHVRDIDPTRLDALDIAHDVRVELLGAAHRAESPETRLLRRRIARRLHPLALADWLLEGDPAWRNGAIERAIREGSQQAIRLPQAIPVHILYWTAWADAQGELNFREDIYGRDDRVLGELRKSPPK